MEKMEKHADEYLNQGFVPIFLKSITNEEKNGWKKKMNGLPKGWPSITKENAKSYIKSSSKCVGIITGKVSGISVIDFDNEESYRIYKERFPKEFSEVITIKTKKGYHCYFKYNSNFKSTTDGFQEELIFKMIKILF